MFKKLVQEATLLKCSCHSASGNILNSQGLSLCRYVGCAIIQCTSVSCSAGCSCTLPEHDIDDKTCYQSTGCKSEIALAARPGTCTSECMNDMSHSGIRKGVSSQGGFRPPCTKCTLHGIHIHCVRAQDASSSGCKVSRPSRVWCPCSLAARFELCTVINNTNNTCYFNIAYQSDYCIIILH